MATVDNERTVKVKHSTDIATAAFIIGLFLYYGLQSIEVKVEIVVDRPKVEQQSSAGSTFKRQM